MLATHYLRVTMIVPKTDMDIVDSAAFALATVRAQRLDDGEFMACWDLGEMAHDSEDGKHFRVPLFAQVEAPGLTGVDQLKLTARIPENCPVDTEYDCQIDNLYNKGDHDYVSIDRDVVASNCRFEGVGLMDLYAKGESPP